MKGGVGLEKASVAVTKAAREDFMSRRLADQCIAWLNLRVKRPTGPSSSGPGGTTSVWPQAPGWARAGRPHERPEVRHLTKGMISVRSPGARDGMR